MDILFFILFKHFKCGLALFFGDIYTADNSCKLFCTLAAAYFADMAFASAVNFPLFDKDMMVGAGRDLCGMCYTNHLRSFGKLG